MVSRREVLKSTVSAWLAWFGWKPVQSEDDRLGGCVVPAEFDELLLHCKVLPAAELLGKKAKPRDMLAICPDTGIGRRESELKLITVPHDDDA